MQRSARIVTRELGAPGQQRGRDEPVALAGGLDLGRASCELSKLVVRLGVARELVAVVQHLQRQRRVLAALDRLQERRERVREPAASGLDDTAEVEEPYALGVLCVR
jgi:hypothetical protein